ncbi:MAG: hypothetical protein ACF8MF_08340 [Phycisphaerales bacterium JB052]|nr:hypothetical protein [Phycisphaerae bacterium]
MDHKPRNPDPEPAPERSHASGDMVCVTLQRPPHFWRFACPVDGTGDLLERLAELADNPDIELTWHDAELIASEIVVHHHLDHPSAGQTNDR